LGGADVEGCSKAQDTTPQKTISQVHTGEVNNDPTVQETTTNLLSPKRVCRDERPPASPRGELHMKRHCSKCNGNYFKSQWSHPQETRHC
jgi:hypothetical protein